MAMAAAIGFGIGFFFFGGLWLTVKGLVASKISGVGMLLSLIGRTALTMAGFYLVLNFGSGPSWERVAACLLGFLCSRVIMARMTAAHLKAGRCHEA